MIENCALPFRLCLRLRERSRIEETRKVSSGAWTRHGFAAEKGSGRTCRLTHSDRERIWPAHRASLKLLSLKHDSMAIISGRHSGPFLVRRSMALRLGSFGPRAPAPIPECAILSFAMEIVLPEAQGTTVEGDVMYSGGRLCHLLCPVSYRSAIRLLDGNLRETAGRPMLHTTDFVFCF